jgi:siroheme synthase-like protein
VHREGSIAIAVSTGGASPALAKKLRERIAEIVGPEHARLAEELRSLRPWAKERFQSYEERKDFFEEIVRERLS